MAEEVKKEVVVERNAFTRIAGSDERLPEDSQVFQNAVEYRKIQMGEVEATPERLVALGDPHPDTQTFDESQVSDAVANEIILADSTEALPKGVAGRILSDGVFEVITGTSSEVEPDITPTEPVKVAKWGENPDAHPRRVVVSEAERSE
jgi:hypothetical protein